MNPERTAILGVIYQGTQTNPEKGISIDEICSISHKDRRVILFIVNYLVDKSFVRIVGDNNEYAKITSNGVDYYEFNTRVK